MDNGASRLARTVRGLRIGSVRSLVGARMRSFRALGRKSSAEIFKELCFCILTANYQARRSIVIQREIGDGFMTLPPDKLAARLRSLGHRFPESRAGYIVEARRLKDTLKSIIEGFKDERELREWLVKNVKGLGYKEASHFMRNIGFANEAIIDFHIVDVLVKHDMTRRPKALSKKEYLRIERILEGLAKRLGMSLAELDLYLWYCETGEVLK